MVNGLLKNHLLIGEDDLPAVKRFKEVVTQEIQYRFNVEEAVEEQSVAVFATILDPHYHQLKFLRDQAKADAYSTFKQILFLMTTEDCQIVEEEGTSQGTEEGGSQPPKKKKKTALEILIGEDDDSNYSSRSLSEEFDNYLKLTPLKSCDNCLEWWSHNSLHFPNLAKLAKRYLCVPATSVPAEQVFSIAGEVINNKRSSLKPENVDMLIFLNKNCTYS